MKRSTFLTVLLATLAGSVAGYGCGDDDAATPRPDGGANADAGMPPPGNDGGATGVDAADAAPPSPPALGVQIDRIGRPAVNTALNNTFNGDSAAAGTAKDAWNADGTSAGWSAKYRSEVAKNLAILDSLDATCGNQIFAAAELGPTRYDTLAGVLADDRMWLNTGSATCTTYLGVELDATGVVPNTDCGGRALAYDVIDVTYSAVAVGAPSGVTDGIAADVAKTGGTTFPFLAAPK